MPVVDITIIVALIFAVVMIVIATIMTNRREKGEKNKNVQ